MGPPGDFSGERILLAAPALAPVAESVRSSQERTDGAGYPDGLGGQYIPLASRIVFVADSFHAMMSDRPYRSATTFEAAIAELQRCCGSQFDAHVVETFVKLLTESRGEYDQRPDPVAHTLGKVA